MIASKTKTTTTTTDKLRLTTEGKIISEENIVVFPMIRRILWFERNYSN